MNATAQTTKAAELGAAAFHRGVSAPALDPELLSMFAGRNFTTPAGEAPTVTLLKAWNRAWTLESLKD
jgi:hypothetical protein